MKDIFKDLENAPTQQDFLLAMRRLEARFRSKPRIGRSANRQQEYVKLGQNPSLAFPATTIEEAKRLTKDTIAVLTRFLGLLGPQGALPLALTHEAHQYLSDGDDSFPRFLDLFNNRFLQLYFRAWADSRPIAQHDRPTEDRFERYTGAPIGLATDVLRGQDSVRDIVKVGFAGLMAPAAKSAARLRALITAQFGIHVEIEEFIGLRLILEPQERSYLGKTNATLKKDAMIGSAVYSVQDKFRLRLYASSLTQYRRFLPTGDLARPLADTIRFYVGMSLAYDIELAVPTREAAPMRLARRGQVGDKIRLRRDGCELGWTSWLAPHGKAAEGWRTDARFDLARRFPPEQPQSPR